MRDTVLKVQPQASKTPVKNATPVTIKPTNNQQAHANKAPAKPADLTPTQSLTNQISPRNSPSKTISPIKNAVRQDSFSSVTQSLQSKKEATESSSKYEKNFNI